MDMKSTIVLAIAAVSAACAFMLGAFDYTLTAGILGIISLITLWISELERDKEEESQDS